MFVTVAGSTGTRSGSSPSRTRGQSSGPLEASGTSHWVLSWYQSTEGGSQEWIASETSSRTAGSSCNGVTSSLSATSYTCQGPEVATGVRSGWASAAATAWLENAM